VPATIAIAAALMGDHQNYFCQITKWTAPESKPPAISLPLVDEQSIQLIYLRRSVIRARTGDWESECEAGLEGIPGKETLGHCNLNTCYYSPYSHTLHQLNGIMRFHLYFYDSNRVLVGCCIEKKQPIRLGNLSQSSTRILVQPLGVVVTPWVLHLKLGHHSDF
jgi:hypothetical protein